MFLLARHSAIIAAMMLLHLSSDVNAQMASASPAKSWVTHLIIADVWPNGYSEVSLLDYPIPVRIVSNINFSVFDIVFTIEAPDAVHNFVMLGVVFNQADLVAAQQSGDLDARGVPMYWPGKLPTPGGPAGYVIIPDGSGSQPSSDSLSVLDAIHAYYESNRTTLQAQAEQRALDQQRIAALEAAKRAAAKPMTGPPAYFKEIIYYPTPSPSPH